IYSKILIFLTIIFLLIFLLIIGYPLLWMVINSFKDTATIFGDTWGLPEKWNFSNFSEAWPLGLSNYFFNSVIVTTLTCLFTVILSAFACFDSSRFSLRGKNFFIVSISAGLMCWPEAG